MRAYNSSGNSGYSNTASATTQSGGGGGSCTCDTGCNGTSISPNFVKEGTGQFCYQATSGNYINSWGMTKVTVNGVDFTNKYAFTSTLPAKINGVWYIYYSSTSAYSHFELKN